MRRLFRDGGVADVEVTAEDGIQPFRSPDDWWLVALGSGLRWTIEQMGQEAATRVRADNIHWLTEKNVDSIETNAIYAVAQRHL